MLNIAICDDNSTDLSTLVDLVKKIDNINFQIHMYLNPEECLKDIDSGIHFDVFLLDILMNEHNGIDIAREIRKTHSDTPIFFITATYEFALQGYEVRAMRYYLKPIEEEKFSADLINVLKQAEVKKNSYITISNTQGLFKIKTSDIYYVESMLRTIQIHTKSETYSMVGKISDLEERLKSNNIIRVHKSFLVNLAYVKNIFKDTITLDNGNEVLLSKHRSKDVHSQLLNYVRENS